MINYAAAVGYGWDDERFTKWWPANLHVVGKDITRFHCVIWPAMLMSAGLPLPAQVFGHGWVYFKGERMSKTIGNIVDPLEAADRFGPDPLRLYLAKEIPYGGDGDFTWERFEEKYNADLANNLGNLVNRVASMTERYQQGTDPATGGGALAASRPNRGRYRASMDGHRAARRRGRGIPADQRGEQLHCRNATVVAGEGSGQGRSAERRAGRHGGSGANRRDAARADHAVVSDGDPARLGDDRPLKDRRLDTDTAWRIVRRKTDLNAGALWPRIEADKGVVTRERRILRTPGATAPAAQAGPSASAAPPQRCTCGSATGAAAPRHPSHRHRTITIDDFAKVELKTAKVLEAERMPKSQRLLKLKVDAGEAEPRTILAGIAESYEPEQLIGKSIVIVANLAPRKMMGLESNGMVLAASPDGGKAFVLNSEPAPPGTRVR